MKTLNQCLWKLKCCQIFPRFSAYLYEHKTRFKSRFEYFPSKLALIPVLLSAINITIKDRVLSKRHRQNEEEKEKNEKVSEIKRNERLSTRSSISGWF